MPYRETSDLDRRCAGFLITLLLATACMPTRWDQPAPVSDSQERSSRGNPPFYEVFGKRYVVMDSSAGYSERGVASWYGSKFHGNPTSSGEIYDMYAMTAAHKTLPLPTTVKVTNLRNGRSVVVKVNDRGPFVNNRIIDMSYSAARQLDMIGAGTTLVEVEALTPGLPGPPVVAAGGAAESAGAGADIGARTELDRSVFLQVGAFGDQINAELMKSRLEADGLANVLIHYQSAATPSLYRVRIGPVSDIDQYDHLVKKVEALNIMETHLVVESGDAGSRAVSDSGSSALPGG